MDKYYVDQRTGNIAIRKRVDYKIEWAQSYDLPDVVWFKEFENPGGIFRVNTTDVETAHKLCDLLNASSEDDVDDDIPDLEKDNKLILDPFIKALLESYQKYINLMGEELDDLMVMASIHGWESKRIEEGKTMRHILGVLEEDVLGEKVIGC